MSATPPATRLVGALGASASVRGRIERAAPVVVDEAGLLVAGHEAVRLSSGDDVIVVVCGAPASADGPEVARRILVDAVRALFAGRPVDALVRPVWGLWSILAFEPRSRRLLLCSHPMGERTIHRVRGDDGAWVVGDEVRDVVGVLDRSPDVDAGSVAAWATTWSFHGERTVFQGVRRLLAGTACVLGPEAEAHVVPWYRPQLPRPADVIDDLDAAVEFTRSEVDAAIARSIAGRSDEVALALSGGVDSSIIVASLCATIGPERVLALSNVFPNYRSADERSLIEQTVAHLGVRSELHEREAPAVLPTWTAWTQVWKVPVSTPMVAITHPLRRHAADLGITALLTGEGGDELFTNWPAPWLADLVRTGRLREAWRLAGELPYAGRGPRSRLRNFREPVSVLLPQRIARLLYEAPFVDLSLVRPEFRDEVRSAEEVSRREAESAGPYWWRGRMAAIGGFRRTADVDGSIRRAARLAGIIEHHPFMHDRLLNEALPRIAPGLHFDNRIDRVVARRALSQRVPAAVAWQPGKRHFSDVLVDAMTGPERGALVDLLRTSERLGEFFDQERVAALTTDQAEAEHGGGPRGWMVDVFKLASVELWLRELER